MIFLLDILTLELFFCKSTQCAFLECPQDRLLCVGAGRQIKGDVLPLWRRNQAVIMPLDYLFIYFE